MCRDGIPTADGVPLGWVAPWENPHNMGVEEERGMSLMKRDTSGEVGELGAPERCRKPQLSDRPSVEGVLRNLEVIPSSILQDYGRQNPVSSTFFVSHLEYRAHA